MQFNSHAVFPKPVVAAPLLRSGPVVLDLQQLRQVAGGLPKGGWGAPATSSIERLPKGGW